MHNLTGVYPCSATTPAGRRPVGGCKSVMHSHERNVSRGRRRPDRIGGETATSEWKCINCGQRYQLEAAERLPDHCYVCGCISFEAQEGDKH